MPVTVRESAGGQPLQVHSVNSGRERHGLARAAAAGSGRQTLHPKPGPSSFSNSEMLRWLQLTCTVALLCPGPGPAALTESGCQGHRGRGTRSGLKACLSESTMVIGAGNAHQYASGT